MKLSMVLVAAALAFSSCNCFKKMAKEREDVKLSVTPEILTLNNGIVAADINVTFPVEYFDAKAVIKVTPVIVFEGGEVAGTTKYYQGSKVEDNYTVVDAKNGGNFTQQRNTTDENGQIVLNFRPLRATRHQPATDVTVKIYDESNSIFFLIPKTIYYVIEVAEP